MLGRSNRENLEEKVDNGETAFTVSVHFLKMSNTDLLLALKNSLKRLQLVSLLRELHQLEFAAVFTWTVAHFYCDRNTILWSVLILLTWLHYSVNPIWALGVFCKIITIPNAEKQFLLNVDKQINVLIIGGDLFLLMYSCQWSVSGQL